MCSSATDLKCSLKSTLWPITGFSLYICTCQNCFCWTRTRWGGGKPNETQQKGSFWNCGEPFRPRPVNFPDVWERRCLTWHPLFSLPRFSPWQVELSIQRGCMTHVWTPSTAFPWLHLWTSSSCVYTEDYLQKSQISMTSGKYVSDFFFFFFFPLILIKLQSCVLACHNNIACNEWSYSSGSVCRRGHGGL